MIQIIDYGIFLSQPNKGITVSPMRVNGIINKQLQMRLFMNAKVRTQRVECL